MSHLSKFYNKIFDYSLKKGTHIFFKDMILFHKTSPKHIIPILTNHIYKEMPIRLANRVTDLNNLPFGLSKKHSINKIREWYLDSFSELISINEPQTPEQVEHFRSSVEKIYIRHSATLTTMSKGLYELQSENKISPIDAPYIQSFLNRFHKNRTEIRIILEQYLSLFRPPLPNHCGIIHLESNLGNILHQAIDNIQNICDSNNIDLYLNDIFKIQQSKSITLPTLEHYLYYILFELLKNSIEAVRFKKNPQIVVTLENLDESWVFIKIQDNGHGIEEENLEKIWYYSYTTHPMETKDILEQDDFSVKSPLSGFGYGLPISDVYMNFLNATPNNIKVLSDKNGTSIYLMLRKYKLK
jgi:pyruvate dehydrogenase kinase 2/3/4